MTAATRHAQQNANMTHVEINSPRKTAVLSHGHVLSAVFFILPAIVVFAPVQTSALLALAAVSSLAAWLWTERRAPPLNRTLILGVAALLLLATLSGFWAIEPIAALLLALRLALLSAAGIILCGIVATLTSDQRRVISRAALLGLALAICLFYVDVLSGGLIKANVLGKHCPEYRAVFYGEYCVDYGRTVSLLVLMAWALLVQPAVRARLFLGVGTVIVMAGILLLTPGFAPKVAWLIGLVALFLAWRFRASFSKLVFALVATAFLLGPTITDALDRPAYYSPLVAPTSTVTYVNTVMLLHRPLIWGFTATRILERPILGWGLDAARRTPGGQVLITPEDFGYTGPEVGKNVTDWLHELDPVFLPLHPHNAILQIWLELGLIGALLACGLVIYLVRAAVRRRHPAGLALLASSFVIANLSYGVWQNWWLAGLWLVTAFYLIGAESADRTHDPDAST